MTPTVKEVIRVKGSGGFTRIVHLLCGVALNLNGYRKGLVIRSFEAAKH